YSDHRKEPEGKSQGNLYRRQFDEVEVTLNYGTAAEKYTPVGQGVTVEKGGTRKRQKELITRQTFQPEQPINGKKR
ncbi:hypothetical protein, partial [Enterocloster clostridioformis]|uniref:hypothetical protein n=1 Tax=Enterocloster clostridioformis TaxID=1531 RepID=UPI001A9A373E